MRCEIEPAQPGRGPAAGALHRVEIVALDGEAASGDLGRQLFCLEQPAPVEGLERAAIRGLAPADGVDGQERELRGIDGEVRLVGIGLDLDVEAHVGSGEGEELGERGKALTVDGLLLGKLLGVFARRIDPADVVTLELIEGERADDRAGTGEPLPVGSTGQVGIEVRVVADDDLAVLGDRKIGFERGDA